VGLLSMLIKRIEINLMVNPKYCYFIGYGMDALRYRLLDYDKQKIIKSRNVIFNEKSLYKYRL